MNQGKAESIIKKALTKDTLVPLWNTAKKHKEAMTPLLNALHRETSIPKSQIVSYLNNRHGFTFKTDIHGH
jgi:hypothetical protein